MRTASIKRKTKETDIEVAVNLDGTGVSKVSTGIGFFDHMLDLLARHSRIDITVKADGDLHVDHHHTTEDGGIALGQAVKQALGTMAGITRYASIHMPMDETLSRVVIDISGRPAMVFMGGFPGDMPVYTVHAPVNNGADLAATDKFTFVRDGFHFWAAVASPVWLLWHRLWLALIGWIVVAVALDFGLIAIGAGRGSILFADLLV